LGTGGAGNGSIGGVGIAFDIGGGTEGTRGSEIFGYAALRASTSRAIETITNSDPITITDALAGCGKKQIPL
jgi:hypothetical protein